MKQLLKLPFSSHYLCEYSGEGRGEGTAAGKKGQRGERVGKLNRKRGIGGGRGVCEYLEATRESIVCSTHAHFVPFSICFIQLEIMARNKGTQT